MFIPDLVHSPGLARNYFLQGDTWTNMQHEMEKNSKIDEIVVTKT